MEGRGWLSFEGEQTRDDSLVLVKLYSLFVNLTKDNGGQFMIKIEEWYILRVSWCTTVGNEALFCADVERKTTAKYILSKHNYYLCVTLQTEAGRILWRTLKRMNETRTDDKPEISYCVYVGKPKYTVNGSKCRHNSQCTTADKPGWQKILVRMEGNKIWRSRYQGKQRRNSLLRESVGDHCFYLSLT